LTSGASDFSKAASENFDGGIHFLENRTTSRSCTNREKCAITNENATSTTAVTNSTTISD
jgi:hypothetical protein